MRYVVVDFRTAGEYLVAGPFDTAEETHAAYHIALVAGECLNGLVMPVLEDEVSV